MLPLSQIGRWNLLVRSTAVVAAAGYLLLVQAASEGLTGYVPDRMRWPVTFGLLEITLIAACVPGLACARGLRERAQRKRAARREQILASLVDLAAQDTAASNRVATYLKWPADFVASLASALHSVRGEYQERLRAAALRADIVECVLRESRHKSPWRVSMAVRALALLPTADAQGRLDELCEDSRDAIRLLARSMVIRHGPAERSLEILSSIELRNLRERIQLFQMFPPGSPALQQYIRDAWSSGSDACIIAALDIIVAHQRYLAVPVPESLAAHPNPEVRTRFFRALPLLSSGEESVVLLRRGLADTEWPVRAMAARACAVMKAGKLVPELVRICQAGEHAAEVGHAARALGRIGGRCWEQLRALTNTPGAAGRQAAHVLQQSMTRGDTGGGHR